MKLNTPISEIMSRNFHVVRMDMCIGKAEKLMIKKGLEILVVENYNEFCGILTIKACRYFRESSKDGKLGPGESLRLKHHSVQEIMLSRLVKLKTTDSLKMASEIMKSIIFQVIPVLHGNKTVGILKPDDIIAFEETSKGFASAR